MNKLIPQPALLVLVCCLIIPVQAAEEDAGNLDQATGLIIAEGWQDVQANCTECHSALLITQNSGSRAVWESRLLWMRETQGMDELGVTLENRILDYLATNYPQQQATRRRNLPVLLLPVSP
ncbi:MAG: hypothetical protein ACR2PR_00930 [Pseudohongiellaceae bacterium]